MKLTIITINRNNAIGLKKTMDSVFAQTSKDFEYIVIDRDAIAHKQNSYLAKEKDTEDLARGILWCLENNKTGKLSVNARRKVEENFSQDIVAKKYIELCKSLI